MRQGGGEEGMFGLRGGRGQGGGQNLYDRYAVCGVHRLVVLVVQADQLTAAVGILHRDSP